MVVVIVEDDDVWRHQLALMYSRILSNLKAVEDYHADIRTFASANDAIEYFKPKRGERSNARPKVDVLSLDLNLGREGGGTGFDVLNAAVNAGQKFVTIAVSGFGDDKDLHEQLGDEGTSNLLKLETRVASQTKAMCLVHEKKKESLWSVEAQVQALEERLRSYVHGNSNVLRVWTDALRKTAVELNGKCLCLHFELPKVLMAPSTQSWIPGVLTRATRTYLSEVGAWNSNFEPLDENSTPSDLLTRLLFLVTSEKRNYHTGLSLRLNHELVDSVTNQYTPPLSKEEWIFPRPREGIKKGLTPRESFLLLQLLFQKRFERNSQASISKVAYGEDRRLEFGYVAERQTALAQELKVSGLLYGRVLQLPGGNYIGNGESLRATWETGAIKKPKIHNHASNLNTKLQEILGVSYPLIKSVDTPFNTYELQLPGFIYIQCETIDA
jgi:hypothetical protein